MLPSIMEPVPPALVQYLSGDSGEAWEARRSRWASDQASWIDEDDYWRLSDLAGSLSRNRFLDSAYLSPSANILMWSDEKSVHIEWDNSQKVIDGELAWTAVKGHFHIPRDEFIKEVESFHFRLIEQMTVRVGQVASGALPPEIRIDLQQLRAEHEERRNAFKLALSNTVSTPWDEVERAILLISAARNLESE